MAGGHARLADFGLARAVTAADGDTLTEAGLAVGTPAYMSPEQASGERDLDGRSDVYSLGCVLYELLAGHPPFAGRTAHEILARHSMDPVPSLRAARPAVPAELEEVIATALAKNPADRFRTAAAFSEQLAQPHAMPPDRGPSVRSRRTRRLVFSGLAAVAVTTVALLLRPEHPAPDLEPVPERTAIAVLPFHNLSVETPHGYFAGGLQAELLTQLSKVGTLTVIGRTSVMSYANSDAPPLRQIARELRVGSVVEGSVQVVGGRLRVHVQLVDAATGANIWTERFDRTLEDAFALQSDIAQRIVAAVGAALRTAERRGLAEVPTANADAYLLYLQGREYVSRAGQAQHNYETAQSLFEGALALDPGFALALAALSEVNGAMHWFRYDPSSARVTRQLEQAAAALRLAPDLPQAHVAMGMAHFWGRRDYRRALDEFAIALDGLPNDAYLWRRIGAVHRRLGNWAEVVTAFEKAALLDPRDADLFSTLGAGTYRAIRRYAEAVGADDRALSLSPDMHIAAVQKGQTYAMWQGQLDTLRAVLIGVPRDADLGFLGTRASQHVELLLWERQADSLFQAIAVSEVTVFQSQNTYLPAALYAAWAHQLRGDLPAAHTAFGLARVLLDSAIRQLPDDWRLHAARGLAEAGLGDSKAALREARWLQESRVYRTDAIQGPKVAEERARILAQAGEAAAAVAEIERLLTSPSNLSVRTLRLDPRWDPIRDHPQFKTLLAKYAGR